jgi:hypothetical protein
MIKLSENNGGFSLSPSMLLKKSNQLLARPLQPVRYFYGSTTLSQGGDPPAAQVGKAHYRLANQQSTTINTPLDGLVIRGDTKLCDKPLLKVKLSTLVASANSAFAILYAVGAMMGPGLGGVAIDAWNPHGLILVLGLFPAILGHEGAGIVREIGADEAQKSLSEADAKK